MLSRSYNPTLFQTEDMGVPVTFSTLSKPAQRSDSEKPTPLSTPCEFFLPVAITECRNTDESDPVVAVLFAENKIRAFRVATLKSVGPLLDLGVKHPHTVICSVDDSFVVTGGAEGCLIVSNVRTGQVSAATQVHVGAVVSVDSWLDQVVSVGRDNMMNCFRFVGGELLPVMKRELDFPPLAVKFGFQYGIMRVFVAYKTWPRITIYPVDCGTAVETFHHPAETCLAGYELCDIAVNKSRTLLAAAFVVEKSTWHAASSADSEHCLEIMIEDLSILSGEKEIILTSCYGTNPKVYWSATYSALWITNDDGTFKSVDFGGIPEEIVYRDSENAVCCLQVCRFGDSDLVIAGAKRGEISLWGIPRI